MATKLPTKRGTKFLLAEDMRSEGDGKFSLLGVFAGEQLIVNGKREPQLPKELEFALPSLAFVFILTDGTGKFQGKYKIIGPDKRVLVDAPAQPVELHAEKPKTIASSNKPFFGSAFGTYTAQLEVGDAVFKFPFKIAKGNYQTK